MMNNYQMILPMVCLSLAVTLILHIIMAVFADSFYRAKVFQIIDDVDEKLDEGAMFDQSFVMGELDANLSQDEMRKLYLGKMGGTNIFSPLMIYFILQFILRLISQL
ncbi:MAG: hypothetical protein ACI4IQ_02765, partial [Eubacterium sp.]